MKPDDKVQRYNFYYDAMSNCYCDMKESKAGNYVTYDAYEQLQAENKKLEIELGAKHNALMDERGANRGMTCVFCNHLERAHCYEQKEQLQAKNDKLVETLELLLGGLLGLVCVEDTDCKSGLTLETHNRATKMVEEAIRQYQEPIETGGG